MAAVKAEQETCIDPSLKHNVSLRAAVFILLSGETRETGIKEAPHLALMSTENVAVMAVIKNQVVVNA